MLALVLAGIAALADVVGGYITVLQRVTPRRIQWLLSLGAGFLLGAAFFDLLPESMAAVADAPYYIAGSYLALFAVEHLFAFHSHAGTGNAHVHDRHLHPDVGHTECDDALLAEHARSAHALVGEPHAESPRLTVGAGFAALGGLLIHAFLDGAAIAVGFLDSSRLGVVVFLAVFLHKLPEGFSLSAVMLAARQGTGRAVLATAALAAATLAGALIALQVGMQSPETTGIFLSLATGSFLYVGASDLIPAVSGRAKSNLLLVLSGALGILLLSRITAVVGL